MAGQTVVVSVLADTGKFARAMDKLGGFGKKFMAGLVIGAVAVAGAVGGSTKALIRHGETASTANARTLQVAKSMGIFEGQAEKVANRLNQVAEATARNTGMDASSIKMTQAKLLTFKGIATSAGQIGGAFDRATQAAVNLEAAGFGKAEQAAVQLGKALNDPIKGITALTRVGVSFTAAEKSKIKALTESGKLTAAQDIILRALETQVGGVAVATANMTDRIKSSWTIVEEHLGQKLLPALDIVGRAVLAAMPAAERIFGPLIDGAVAALKAVDDFTQGNGGLLASLVQLASSISPLAILFHAIQPILPQLAAGFADIGQVVSSALLSALPALQPSLDTLAKVIGDLVAAVLPVFVDLLGLGAQVFAQLLPPLAQVVTKLVSGLAPILTRLAPLFSTVARVVGTVLLAVLPTLTAILDGVSSTIAEGLLPALAPLIDSFNEIAIELAPIITELAQLVGPLLPPLIMFVAKAAVTFIRQLVPAITTATRTITATSRAASALVKWFISIGTAAVRMYQAASSKFNALGALLNRIKGIAQNAVSGAIGWLSGAGLNIVRGLWAGISDGYGWITGKLRTWTGDVVAFIKRQFGINSPATTMIGPGGNLVEGVGVGVVRKSSALLNPLKKLAAQAVTAFNPSLSMPIAAPTTVSGYTRASTAAPVTLNITINGAIDPRATARQIRDILTQDARVRGVLGMTQVVMA